MTGPVPGLETGDTLEYPEKMCNFPLSLVTSSVSCLPCRIEEEKMGDHVSCFYALCISHVPFVFHWSLSQW